MKRLSPFLATVAACLAIAPSGAPHGRHTPGVGYVSTVAGTVPNVLGVQARVLGGDDRLRLANVSGKTIVVDGYDGEPFLRLGPDGVFENERSPATYLSVDRDPTRAYVPRSADPKAPPSWRKVRGGTSFEWHDHRIHWTGAEPPPAVQRAPQETHMIRNWRVPARADGKRFAITGFLGYVPPPSRSDGTRWWPFALGIGAVVVAAAAAGLGVRRARRRTP